MPSQNDVFAELLKLKKMLRTCELGATCKEIRKRTEQYKNLVNVTKKVLLFEKYVIHAIDSVTVSNNFVLIRDDLKAGAATCIWVFFVKFKQEP